MFEKKKPFIISTYIFINFLGKMPFKIVETVEKGKSLLFIVPSLWETNGILKWPKNCLDVRKLVMNENCLPATGWSASRCRVKRHSIPSFSEAERELELMLERSDTDDTDREIQNSKVQFQKENVNYNALAEQLVCIFFLLHYFD